MFANPVPRQHRGCPQHRRRRSVLFWQETLCPGNLLKILRIFRVLSFGFSPHGDSQVPLGKLSSIRRDVCTLHKLVFHWGRTTGVGHRSHQHHGAQLGLSHLGRGTGDIFSSSSLPYSQETVMASNCPALMLKFKSLLSLLNLYMAFSLP